MKIIDISKKIAEEDVDNELINHLNFIKRSLNQVPDNFVNKFKDDIEAQLSQIDQMGQVQIAKINQAVENKNIEELTKVIKEAKFSITEQEKKKINAMLSEKILKVQDLIHNQKYNEALNEEFQVICEIQKIEIAQKGLVANITRDLYSLINKKFQELQVNLTRIFSVEILQQFGEAFTKNHAEFLVELLHFREIYDKSESIIHNFDDPLIKIFSTALTNIQQTNTFFQQSIQNVPIRVKEVSKSMLILRKYQNFFTLVHQRIQAQYPEFKENHPKVADIITIIEQIISNNQFEQFCQTLKTIIESKSQQIQSEVSLINEQTKHNQNDRVKYYQDIQLFFDFNLEMKTFQPELDPLNLNTESQNCLKKIEELIQQLDLEPQIIQDRINQGNREQIGNIGQAVLNLEQIAKNCPRFAGQAKKIHKKLEENILAKINTKQIEIKDLLKQPIHVSTQLILLETFKTHCKVDKFEDEINKTINAVLEEFAQANKSDAIQINALMSKLKDSAEGQQIVSQNYFFQGYQIALFNQKVQCFTINNVLAEISGDFLDKDYLLKTYNIIMQEYKKLVEIYLTPGNDIKNLINLINQCSTCYQGQPMSKELVQDIPQLIARIFTLWTVLRAEQYFKLKDTVAKNQGAQTIKQQQQYYLLQPHAAQIVSILRILCQGYKGGSYNQATRPYLRMKREQIEHLGKTAQGRQRMFDNFVQINTGEGKSVTLAVVSIIFALYGFDVNCACYSSFLSWRDYKDFENIFQQLNVSGSIFYGTFNQICERFINREGPIRDMVLNQVLKNYPNIIYNPQQQKPQILLIDEVDVFFGKDFYNQAYIPLAVIKDTNGSTAISGLLDYIWSIKDQKPKYLEIIKTPQFLQCAQLFNDNYVPLLNEQVKHLLSDLQDFNNHKWVLHDGKIGYQDQDQISFTRRYGYKTLFAHYQERENGPLSNQTLEENKSLALDCAEFSYSEIPNYFCLTLGVTGTLTALSKSEMHIIKDVFQMFKKIKGELKLLMILSVKWILQVKSYKYIIKVTFKNNRIQLIKKIVNQRYSHQFMLFF